MEQRLEFIIPADYRPQSTKSDLDDTLPLMLQSASSGYACLIYGCLK